MIGQQNPNFKQNPNLKFQGPNGIFRLVFQTWCLPELLGGNSLGVLGFGIWVLFGIWLLEFGI